MKHSSIFVSLIFGLLFTLPHLSEAFRCFKCSSKTDDLCIEDPNSISSGDVTVECTGYCTIVRTEFTDIPGQAISFVRDCEVKPLIQNEIRTDAHYTKYYTSCNKDKCNSGDGIYTTAAGGNLNMPSDIMYVPENSSSLQSNTVSALALGIVLAICHILF